MFLLIRCAFLLFNKKDFPTNKARGKQQLLTVDEPFCTWKTPLRISHPCFVTFRFPLPASFPFSFIYFLSGRVIVWKNVNTHNTTPTIIKYLFCVTLHMFFKYVKKHIFIQIFDVKYGCWKGCFRSSRDIKTCLVFTRMRFHFNKINKITKNLTQTS